MNKISVYTDGASSCNPGPGGCACVINDGKNVHSIVKGYRLTTNNRMEIMAILNALEYLKSDNREINIYTDSQYVSNSYNQKWILKWERDNFRNKKNEDLWRRFIEYSRILNITITWIRGHNGNEYNELCDKLATGIIKQRDLEIDVGYEKTSKRSKEQNISNH